MPFRRDNDLMFLKYCDDAELKNLADILTYTASGRRRQTSRLNRSELFATARKTGRYTAVWRDIAEEMQLCGGNTLMNLLRGGRGVTYRSIIKSLCRSLLIETNRRMSLKTAEETLSLGVFQKTLAISDEKLRKKTTADPSLLLEPRRPRVKFFLIFAAFAFLCRFHDAFVLNHLISLPFLTDLAPYVTFLTTPAALFLAFLWAMLPLCAMNRRTALIACLYIIALRKNRDMAADTQKQMAIKNKTNGVFSPTFAGGSINRAARSTPTETKLMPQERYQPSPETTKDRVGKAPMRPMIRPMAKRIVIENEYVNS